VGFILAEALCRVAESLRCVDREDVLSEPNRFYGWRLTPRAGGWGQHCLHGHVEWRAYSRINGNGLRDRDIPYERHGGFRVLVLGDSFIEAHQVDIEQSVTKRIERALAARPSVPHPVEVINAGVSAFGTDNELLYYLHEGSKYRADLILLAFFTGNDVMENHHELIGLRGVPYPRKPYFELVDGRLVVRDHPLPPERTIVRWKRDLRQLLERRAALYRLLSALALPRQASAAAPPALQGLNAQLAVYLKESPERWRQAWRITRGLLLRLRQAVEANGSRFGVIVVNDRVEVADQYWQWVFSGNSGLDPADFDRDRPDRLLTAFLERRGIRTIRLLDAFRARFGEAGTPGFFSWDGHWDVPGHELAADAITADLLAHGDASRPGS